MNKLEHSFTWLRAIYTPFSVKCPFTSLARFSITLFTIFFLFIEALYILAILHFNLQVSQLHWAHDDWTGLNGEKKGQEAIILSV